MFFLYIFLFSCMGDAEDFQFFFGQPNAPKHQAVAFKSFDGVDSHAAHQFLDFMPPCGHKVYKTLTSCIRIQPFYKLRILCGDTPVTFAAVGGAAQMADLSQQGGVRDIAGVRAQSYRFDHI